MGGSIAGKTRTASVAVYEAVERMDYLLTNHYALILTGSSFLILIIVFLLKGNKFASSLFSESISEILF